jgi:hypothetical protein
MGRQGVISPAEPCLLAKVLDAAGLGLPARHHEVEIAVELALGHLPARRHATQDFTISSGARPSPSITATYSRFIVSLLWFRRTGRQG